jgi:hypothetical protein
MPCITKRALDGSYIKRGLVDTEDDNRHFRFVFVGVSFHEFGMPVQYILQRRRAGSEGTQSTFR